MEILKKIFKTFKNGGLASACVISRNRRLRPTLRKDLSALKSVFVLSVLLKNPISGLKRNFSILHARDTHPVK